jgi:hypothetical protein
MIDLDAARAERAAAKNEKEKKAPELKFGGVVFELPPELPLDVVFDLKKLSDATKAKDGSAITESLLHAMRVLVGDRYDEFMTVRPSINDLVVIVEGIPGEYGLGLGNVSASPKPSKTTTGRSKRPSKPATK